MFIVEHIVTVLFSMINLAQFTYLNSLLLNFLLRLNIKE